MSCTSPATVQKDSWEQNTTITKLFQDWYYCEQGREDWDRGNPLAASSSTTKIRGGTWSWLSAHSYHSLDCLWKQPRGPGEGEAELNPPSSLQLLLTQRPSFVPVPFQMIRKSLLGAQNGPVWEGNWSEGSSRDGDKRITQPTHNVIMWLKSPTGW